MPKLQKGCPRVGGRKPGTRNKVTKEIAAVARMFGPEAIEILVDIARNGAEERNRIQAAKLLLDRGYGKSPNSLLIGEAGAKPLSLQIEFVEPETEGPAKYLKRQGLSEK